MNGKRWTAFARDLADEVQAAWGVARMGDCARTYGHDFARPRPSSLPGLGMTRTCKRCGTERSDPTCMAVGNAALSSASAGMTTTTGFYIRVGGDTGGPS